MHSAEQQGPEKLRITLNQAVFGPFLGVRDVWFAVVLGSMQHGTRNGGPFKRALVHEEPVVL